MAARLALLAVVGLGSILLVGCSGGEVKPEQVDSYQKAGRAPGDPVIKATGGSEAANER